MNHIFPPKRLRQYSAIGVQNQPHPGGTFGIRPDPPRLIQLAVSILTRILGMKQKHNLPFSCRIRDPIRSCDQCSRSRFKPKPIQGIALKRGLGSCHEIGGNLYPLGLEGASQRTFELAAGHRRVEYCPVDTNPRAPPRSSRPDIRCHEAIGAKGESYQTTLWRTITADYATAFGFVCRLMPR
jgi:hypothetical protein